MLTRTPFDSLAPLELLRKQITKHHLAQYTLTTYRFGQKSKAVVAIQGMLFRMNIRWVVHLKKSSLIYTRPMTCNLDSIRGTHQSNGSSLWSGNSSGSNEFFPGDHC